MLDRLDRYAERIGPERGSGIDPNRMPPRRLGWMALVAVPVYFFYRLAFS